MVGLLRRCLVNWSLYLNLFRDDELIGRPRHGHWHENLILLSRMSLIAIRGVKCDWRLFQTIQSLRGVLDILRFQVIEL